MGETCEQADADDDGVGDACDQCVGRPDEGTCDACPFPPCPAPCGGDPEADCGCGDGILDLPSEQCDLGGENGSGPCSSTCTIEGTCKGSGTPCLTASECPPGQGCCGNNIVEANEACDDGNNIENDPCLAACEANALGTPILGCEDLTGPNIIAAGIKTTKFKDKPDVAEFDRWKTKGTFVFSQGLTFDPETQDVKIIYNNNTSGLLFQSTLEPGDCNPPLANCFVQSGTPAKPKWKFLDQEADIAGAPSWRKGKFKLKNGTTGIFTLDGRNAPLFTLAELGGPPRVTRQTIRVDDLCITGVVNCILSGNGKALKCNLQP
jgi:cysteine-rich repeat protein